MPALVAIHPGQILPFEIILGSILCLPMYCCDIISEALEWYQCNFIFIHLDYSFKIIYPVFVYLNIHNIVQLPNDFFNSSVFRGMDDVLW